MNGEGSMVEEVDPFEDMSVVVVDDSRNFLKLVRSILRNFGLKDCTCFDDPAAALAYLEIHSVDAVIMDLIMPKMNGFELAHKIRHSTEIANRLIPIIMVTGHANRENISKAINSGIDEVLVKPFRPVDLRKRLFAIATNPRRYIHTAQGYAGPERRRERDKSYFGPDRRVEDEARRIDRGTGKPQGRRGEYFDQPPKRESARPAATPKVAEKTARSTKAPSDVFTVKRGGAPARRAADKPAPIVRDSKPAPDSVEEVWEL